MWFNKAIHTLQNFSISLFVTLSSCTIHTFNLVLELALHAAKLLHFILDSLKMFFKAGIRTV